MSKKKKQTAKRISRQKTKKLTGGIAFSGGQLTKYKAAVILGHLDHAGASDP